MVELLLAKFIEAQALRLMQALLDASARLVKRRFEKIDQQKALEAALADGLKAALDTFQLAETTDRDHFQRLFEEFLGRPLVVEEFSKLLDPRPETVVDLTLLREEFAGAGFEPEALVAFDFDEFIRRFIGSFYDSAAKRPALQGAIEIGLLRGIAERLGAIEQATERTADAAERIADTADEITALVTKVVKGQARSDELHEAIHGALKEGFERTYQALESLDSGLRRAGYDVDIDKANTVVIGDNTTVGPTLDQTVIQQLQAEITRLREAITGHVPTEAELDALEARYRQHLIRWFDRLTFAGMMRTAKAISLPLEDVYVELRAVAEVPEAADVFSVEERRLLLEKEGADEETRRELLRELDALRRERWSRTLPERKSIAETLYGGDKRAFVILGDPGSGKTTLLHLLALVFAKGPERAQARLKVPAHEADRLPIFIPLAAFDDMLRETRGLSLLEFLSRYYDRRRGLPGLAPLLQRALESGKALVLLDGLDEVLDVTTRDYVARQADALIGEWAGRGVRFAVTSRFVGYREAPLSGNLPHLSVLDFGQQEIETFIHQWALAYEKWAAGGEQETPEVTRKARELEKDLLDDVRSNPSVQRLAANPLMLTMLALLRRQVGRLPHRRISLYERYMGTLIENWMEARSPGERERGVEMLDPHEAERILIPLALWLQREKPSGTAGKAEIRAELIRIYLEEAGYDARARLSRPHKREAEDKAERFLREMRQMAGLIVERGQDAYGFLHLTFQEYFAGRALALLDDEARWQTVHPNLHKSGWREPILLCAGRLGVVENRRPQVTDFVRRIAGCEDETEPDLHRNLLLALAIAGDDVNLEPALISELINHAAACLPTTVYALARELIGCVGQLSANGATGAGACLSPA